MNFSQSKYETTRTELEASRRRYWEIMRTDDCTSTKRVDAALAMRDCQAAFHRSFGWHEINDDDEWNRLSCLLEAKLFPDGLQLPAPFVTWNVDHLKKFGNDRFQEFRRDIHQKCIQAIKECGCISPWCVMENVSHPWYQLHLDAMPDHFDPWPVEIVPNADPFYLVNHDFSCGLISQHSGPLSVFGDPLLDIILTDPPKALTRAVCSRLND